MWAFNDSTGPNMSKPHLPSALRAWHFDFGAGGTSNFGDRTINDLRYISHV
ncbi:MAG: hypothetical protein H8E62_00020 [Planctomycetes bacterium]|nr:hypothetical protein [Planctomycetota bacterium]